MLDSKNIELKIKDGAKLNFPINIILSILLGEEEREVLYLS